MGEVTFWAVRGYGRKGLACCTPNLMVVELLGVVGAGVKAARVVGRSARRQATASAHRPWWRHTDDIAVPGRAGLKPAPTGTRRVAPTPARIARREGASRDARRR